MDFLCFVCETSSMQINWGQNVKSAVIFWGPNDHETSSTGSNCKKNACSPNLLSGEENHTQILKLALSRTLNWRCSRTFTHKTSSDGTDTWGRFVHVSYTFHPHFKWSGPYWGRLYSKRIRFVLNFGKPWAAAPTTTTTKHLCLYFPPPPDLPEIWNFL